MSRIQKKNNKNTMSEKLVLKSLFHQQARSKKDSSVSVDAGDYKYDDDVSDVAKPARKNNGRVKLSKLKEDIESLESQVNISYILISTCLAPSFMFRLEIVSFPSSS